MRRPFVVLPLVGILAAGHAFDAASARCSLASPFDVGVKHGRTTYVLGAARPDTILAGRGAVDYATGDGHFGPGTDRQIYGQMFAVERIGTPASASLPAAVSAALVVPWDYGADCRASPWSRSARWLTPGERGLVIGGLRDSRHWVDGIPTLDVHMPQAQPYPRNALTPRSGDSPLSADEVFSLLEAMPERERLQQAPEAALAPLRNWVIANPATARRWPASDAIRGASFSAEWVLLRRIVPPIGGTYRFTLARPGQDSAVFYMRTLQNPASTWNDRRTESDSLLGPVRMPDGYYLQVLTAASERQLATGDSGQRLDGEGYVAVMREPRQRPDGSQEWLGRLDIDQTRFAGLTVTDRGDIYSHQGAFVMSRGGGVRAEFTIGQSDGRPLVFRGERVSTAVVESR